MFSTKACPRSSINISNLDRKRLSVVILPKGGFTKKKKERKHFKKCDVVWENPSDVDAAEFWPKKQKRRKNLANIVFFFSACNIILITYEYI